MIPYIYKHPDGRILLCHKDVLLSARVATVSDFRYLQGLIDRPINQIEAAKKAIEDLKVALQENKSE
jgi:hypothetical protein